jgi:hypothetical protein
MKKFSITMVSLATMAGLAVAQAPKADPKAGAGSAAPKAPAAGSAAGAGSAKAPAAGSAAGAAAGSAAQAPKMEMPKPPAEVAAALKQMGARQTCTGLTWGGPDGKTELKAKGTSTNALALDGWAIKSAMNMTMGEGKSKMTFKMEGFMTYDPKLGKWHNVSVSNDGSIMVGLTEMKDGKLETVSDMKGGMMGNGKFRDHGDVTDPKAMKMWGEMSMDNGKTWTKVYEMTCKK